MLLVGSVLDRLPGAKYAAELRFAEVSFRAPLPRVATLRKMRANAPEALLLALRAPRSTLSSARGPLRFDAALERSFDWLLAAREALSAKLVVLPTPSDLATGQRDRELLAAFSARLPREAGRHWVWAPSGPWEREQAERVARELDLVLEFDPLLDPVPEGKVAYARLQAIGARRSFSEAVLQQVAELLDGSEERESFVAIDAERAFAHATRLQRIADALHDGP